MFVMFFDLFLFFVDDIVYLFFTTFLQVAATSFAIFVFTGNVLTASKAFVALSLFNVMRFPLVLLPDVIVSCIQVGTCWPYFYGHLPSHTKSDWYGVGWKLRGLRNSSLSAALEEGFSTLC